MCSAAGVCLGIFVTPIMLAGDVHYWTHGSIGPFVLKAPMVCVCTPGAVSKPYFIGACRRSSAMRALAWSLPLEMASITSAYAHALVLAGLREVLGRCARGAVPVPTAWHGMAWQVGDEVALEPGVPCGGCRECCHGQYNLCPDVEFFATPPVHGSFARYINHPAKYCFKLPAGVSLEEGAMVEPMSVGVHACRRAGVSAGHTVLVLGAGPIGTCVAGANICPLPPTSLCLAVQAWCPCLWRRRSGLHKLLSRTLRKHAWRWRSAWAPHLSM